eukprot:scaffold28373_cov52-Prasinocladus_malaysianus.AAC.1
MEKPSNAVSFIYLCLCHQNLKEKIAEHYRVHMVLDNLPVTTYDLEEFLTASENLYAAEVDVRRRQLLQDAQDDKTGK